jgi:hypothetical protein
LTEPEIWLVEILPQPIAVPSHRSVLEHAAVPVTVIVVAVEVHFCPDVEYVPVHEGLESVRPNAPLLFSANASEIVTPPSSDSLVVHVPSRGLPPLPPPPQPAIAAAASTPTITAPNLRFMLRSFTRAAEIRRPDYKGSPDLGQGVNEAWAADGGEGSCA